MRNFPRKLTKLNSLLTAYSRHNPRTTMADMTIEEIKMKVYLNFLKEKTDCKTISEEYVDDSDAWDACVFRYEEPDVPPEDGYEVCIYTEEEAEQEAFNCAKNVIEEQIENCDLPDFLKAMINIECAAETAVNIDGIEHTCGWGEHNLHYHEEDDEKFYIVIT